LARKFLPGFKSYSLGKICHDLGIENSARHRALGDAYATFELFKIIKSKMDNSVTELSGENKIPLPPMMRREEFESLPAKVGVYYFYDDAGQILYIGKSRNIKRRVTQHLNPNLKKRKDIQLKSLIAKVKFVLIPNELAALLFECHEIKKNRPPFNKALKRIKFPYGLELKKKSTGVFEIISKHNDGSYHPAFLVKSKRMALLRIDSLYTGLVGPFLNEFERNEKIELLIKKIGQENFNKLIEKIKNNCPTCKTPGFGITGVKEGLPCSACKAPTRSVLSHLYSCQKCNYEEFKVYPYDKTEEDPMYCDRCNP
jgi:predicted GIY-YIG superfamily endonuclease